VAVAVVVAGPALLVSELVDVANVAGSSQTRTGHLPTLLNNTKCTRQDVPGIKGFLAEAKEPRHTICSRPLVWPVVIRMR